MSDMIVVSLVVKPCGYLHFAVTYYLSDSVEEINVTLDFFFPLPMALFLK